MSHSITVVAYIDTHNTGRLVDHPTVLMKVFPVDNIPRIRETILLGDGPFISLEITAVAHLIEKQKVEVHATAHLSGIDGNTVSRLVKDGWHIQDDD